MNLKCHSILTAVLVAAVPFVTCASSLECHGNIVSQGDTEEQLLKDCGNPTSRDGTDWLYDVPGSLSVVVTMGNGVVMFIRDADEVEVSPANPLGDHP